jgi:hypothetical protein
MHPGARSVLDFFSAHVFTFWRADNSDTMHALLFSKHASELFLLFSRTDVAKEFEILRKMDKKMSKNATRRNTFGKKRAGYNINGPKGLKSAGHRDPTYFVFFVLIIYNENTNENEAG